MTDKTDHDLLLEIHTVLLGTNGQGGLCRSHEDLRDDFYKFKRVVIILFAFAAGGGGLGFGIVEILKLVK